MGYSALYGTLAETGDVLYLGLREGYRHTSYGTKEVLPGTIERVSKHFRQVRMRADSGYYSQALVKICEERGVEFFIVAKQHRNLMNAVREIQDSNWKSFADRDLQADARGRRRRRRRANLKRKIAIRRKPNSRFKGAPEVAGMMFKPKSWNKARRYVIKRTPIVDKDDQQLYLDDAAPVRVLDRGEPQSAATSRCCESRRGVATRRTSLRTSRGSAWPIYPPARWRRIKPTS